MLVSGLRSTGSRDLRKEIDRRQGGRHDLRVMRLRLLLVPAHQGGAGRDTPAMSHPAGCLISLSTYLPRSRRPAKEGRAVVSPRDETAATARR